MVDVVKAGNNVSCIVSALEFVGKEDGGFVINFNFGGIKLRESEFSKKSSHPS